MRKRNVAERLFESDSNGIEVPLSTVGTASSSSTYETRHKASRTRISANLFIDRENTGFRSDGFCTFPETANHLFTRRVRAISHLANDLINRVKITM